VNNGAILELDGHRLIGAFHKESDELHCEGVKPAPAVFYVL